ncbi:MAG: hypothetical protein ACK5HS_03430 [Mycoplasmatales bacterium]
MLNIIILIILIVAAYFITKFLLTSAKWLLKIAIFLFVLYTLVSISGLI